jgi:hypothetical protein
MTGYLSYDDRSALERKVLRAIDAGRDIGYRRPTERAALELAEAVLSGNYRNSKIGAMHACQLAAFIIRRVSWRLPAMLSRNARAAAAIGGFEVAAPKD